MRLARHLLLLGSAILLTGALGVAPASADALRQSGVPVAVGFALNLNAINVTFAGPFAQPVTCTNAAIGSTVTVNNVVGPVRATLNGFSWVGCTMPGPPIILCTVSVNALPWVNAVRLDSGMPKTFAIGFPTVGVLSITCTLATGAVTCSYKGAAGAPPSFLSGGWTDAPSGPPSLAVVQFFSSALNKVAPSAPGCGPFANYTAKYSTTASNLSLTP
jgi:hypothetical protein